MISKIIERKFYFFTVLFSLFFIFSFTVPSSDAHVLIIADGNSDNPSLITEADNTADALESKGYKVKKLYQKNATTRNIMKGLYNADAVIYLGHGGYQSGHYDNNGGTATKPFAMVGSDDFVWGIDDKIREGWKGKVITAPFKSKIPVILAHACFSTGYVGSTKVANPTETIYNFSRMFNGAGANYYATAYYGKYNGKTVVDIVDEFLNGATSFGDANSKNSQKITSYYTYNGVKIWRNVDVEAAFVGDWSATFPSASQTTAYNDADAEAWYQSYVLGNIDLTSPIIKATNPANTAKGVSLTSPVKIYFSENIQEGSNFSDICLKNINTGETVPLNYLTISGQSLYLNNLNLLNSTYYQVYIPMGAVKDASDNLLAGAYSFIIKTYTPDPTPLKVTSTKPANGATGVFLSPPITLTFSENIKSGANFSKIIIKNLSNGKTAIISSKTISGKTLTLKMKNNRLRNSLYKVYIPVNAVKDADGYNLTESYSFTFLTYK